MHVYARDRSSCYTCRKQLNPETDKIALYIDWSRTVALVHEDTCIPAHSMFLGALGPEEPAQGTLPPIQESPDSTAAAGQPPKPAATSLATKELPKLKL